MQIRVREREIDLENNGKYQAGIFFLCPHRFFFFLYNVCFFIESISASVVYRCLFIQTTSSLSLFFYIYIYVCLIRLLSSSRIFDVYTSETRNHWIDGIEDQKYI